MSFEGSLFVPARALVKNWAELAVRRYTATYLCVPVIPFMAKNVIIAGVDTSEVRHIETMYDVLAEYLGDPQALAAPQLQLTSEERL